MPDGKTGKLIATGGSRDQPDTLRHRTSCCNTDKLILTREMCLSSMQACNLTVCLQTQAMLWAHQSQAGGSPRTVPGGPPPNEGCETQPYGGHCLALHCPSLPWWVWPTHPVPHRQLRQSRQQGTENFAPGHTPLRWCQGRLI